MKKIINLANQLIEGLLAAVMLVMSLIVLWQVFTRFVLNSPSVWSEEVARCLMVWMAVLGGAIGVKYGVHIGLVFIVEKLPSYRLRKGVELAGTFLCLIFGWIIFYYGLGLVENGVGQRLMTVNIPMPYVYSIVPISGVVFMVNFGIIAVKDALSLWKGGKA